MFSAASGFRRGVAPRIIWGVNIDPRTIERLRNSLDPDRLVETAVRLIEVPSPTRSAAAVADRLAEMLTSEGFPVERPDAGWPDAPAVVARLGAALSGRALQFNGHLDTVHLPFVPPRVENGFLRGSGAADMKGGIAAAFEAMRILRETGLLKAGSVLLTAHDLHESPWGDGSQVDGLIDGGYVGDGVLLPEYLSDRLPVAGRGLAILKVRVHRDGPPVHEVLGGAEQPDVIAGGAEVIRRFRDLDQQLARNTHPLAGRESLFVGQAGGGEIYNQSPTEFQLAGTRRWIPGTQAEAVERQYRAVLARVADETGTYVDGEFLFVRDAFELGADPLVDAFQSAATAVMGEPLPRGAKPFVDDGNTFMARGGVPAITHGPNATGAHTLEESVPVDELVRVALVYAATAIRFCTTIDE